MSTIHTVSAPFGAHPIIIETGKLANLADGAVTVRYGDTLVIVTAVSATKIRKARISSRSPSSTASARRRSARSPAATSNAKVALPRRKSLPVA